MVSSARMSLASISFYFCLAFLGGVGLNSLVFTPKLLILSLFVLGVTFISVFWRKSKRIVIIGFCALVFAVGIYRSQMFELPKETSWMPRPPTSSFLDPVREKLSASIDRFLSPPQSSLLGAIMLGQTQRLSKDLKEQLNASGTRHITALSGMNIMILAEMLIGIGLIFGMWRGQAFYFAIIAIALFIIMVGASASVVRAGIMGGIVLFAEKVGRPSQAKRLLIIAATIMLALDPMLLRYDIGFQLSFLATLGIAKLLPWFREKLSRVPEILSLRSTIAMTLPAIIFTAPILAANFGQVSVISIVTNILIVPALSFILGFGIFASIISAIFAPIGSIVFSPVWLALSYIYKIIEWSAAVPFAFFKIDSFPWYFVVLYFILLWWGIRRFHLER